MCVCFENKEGRVRTRWLKTDGVKKGGKTLKPSPGRLFKTIERVLKVAHMVREGWVSESERLTAENGFVESDVQESVLHIQLVNGPRRGNGKTKNHTNCAGLNDRRESFVEVNAGLLRVTAANPTSFVARKRPVGVEFVPKNPLAGNNISTGWACNKRPCVFLQKSVILLLHCVEPVWVKKSGFVRVWYGGERSG